MNRRLGAALTPGGYVLGVGGSQPDTMVAPITAEGGVVQVQPGIGDAPNTISPDVTGYGAQPGAASGNPLANLSVFQEILIVLGIVGAIVLIPQLMKK